MSRWNQILIVALLAQAAMIAATHARKDDQAIRAPQKVIAAFDPAKVTRLEVQGLKSKAGEEIEKVVISRSGETWNLESSGGYAAKQSKVDDFLKAVKKLQHTGPVATKSAYHRKLQVHEDRWQRKATLTVDGKEVVLYVGTTPGHKKTHVRLGGQDEVYLATGLQSWDVGQKSADWVDRDYVKIDEKDAWSVDLVNAKGHIKLDKDPSGVWALLGAQKPTKKTALDELVRKATKVTLEEPVGRGEKPEHGFATPLATVTLVTGTSTVSGMPPPTTQTQTLRVGGKIGSSYFVKSSTSDFVAKVTATAIQPLIDKTESDLYETEEEKK